MSIFHSLGLRRRALPARSDDGVEFVVRQPALRRVLNFRGRSIDDVINNPLVRREIQGYFKLLKQIDRECERTELEKQWGG